MRCGENRRYSERDCHVASQGNKIVSAVQTGYRSDSDAEPCSDPCPIGVVRCDAMRLSRGGITPSTPVHSMSPASESYPLSAITAPGWSTLSSSSEASLSGSRSLIRSHWLAHRICRGMTPTRMTELEFQYGSNANRL